jgi:Skp family chaperone for outer membrane proteins
VRRLLAAAAIAGCACAVGAHAAMYKWVDEKGVTQYSETPPPDGKATKIDVRPTPPSAPVKPAKDDWKQRDLESRQRKLQEDMRHDRDEQRAAQRAAQRKSRCEQAQREIDVLQPGRPVYQVNERGERVYLDDKDRAREMEGWQRIARENCE